MNTTKNIHIFLGVVFVFVFATYFQTTHHGVHTALAASNQFTVGITVVADVVPPSVPGGVSATTISSTQINLAWTASTDNVAVGGYRIRRGGAIIASTTAVTYSDTGLTPSTGYTYTVEAFDTTLNYSGQSAQAAATTSAGGGGGGGDTTPPSVITFSPSNGATGISPTTTLSMTFNELVSVGAGNITVRRFSDSAIFETIAVTGPQVSLLGSVATISLSGTLLPNTQYYVEADIGTFRDQANNPFAGISGGATWSFTTVDYVAPVISGVSATTTYTTATLTFATDENARATLQWGTTTSYGDGSASEVVYVTAHTMSITGLATSTLYYYRITARDTSNKLSAAVTGNFTTQSPPPPPDITPPANPSGFTAVPSLTSIALTWTNPSDPDFQAVRVMRRTTGYPASPSDGILVYDGGAQSANDSGLATGTLYYYTIFARDAVPNYSSGAIVSATTLTETVTPPPPPPPPPPTPPGTPPAPPGTPPAPPTPPGTSPATPGTPPPPPTPITPPITPTSTGPFVDFPATGTPSAAISALTLGDFVFTQLSPDVVLPVRDGVVRTNGEKNLSISISASKFPNVLKTIAVSVTNPNQGGKTSSYLLSINKDKTVYEAVLPPFSVEDEYPLLISIFDHDKQGLMRITGTLDVYMPMKLPSIIPAAIADAVNEAIETIQGPVSNISPIATPIGVAVGASQAVLLATNVGSVYDVYLLLLKLIGLLTGLFRRKRHEPWGVVYDSVTKRPLDPAYVIAQIRDTTTSKGEAITDLDGRYGFLLNPGEYIITANKTHYKFPSDKLKGKTRDELYENLYFGDSFQVREGGAVTYNIPLDPVEFDWNEFAKQQDQVFQVYSKKTTVRLWFFNIIFYVGLLFSTLALIVTPSIINTIVVFVYLAIIGFQIFWRVTHKVTRVLNKTTGFPIPFALIKVWLPGLNTVVKKTVADQSGQFYFLVPPGTYYITVEEKLPDATYHQVLRTADMELKKGVVKGDFLV